MTKEYQKRRNISLSDDYADKAKEMGGTVSEGIRVAIDRCVEFDAIVAEIEHHRDILAMHLAEIKAIDDGKSANTITDTINHCLAEIAELDL